LFAGKPHFGLDFGSDESVGRPTSRGGWPAFLLGHNPAAQMICASYAQDFSEKLGRDTRTIMQSGVYRRAFGERLVHPRNRATT